MFVQPVNLYPRRVGRLYGAALSNILTVPTPELGGIHTQGAKHLAIHYGDTRTHTHRLMVAVIADHVHIQPAQPDIIDKH